MQVKIIVMSATLLEKIKRSGRRYGKNIFVFLIIASSEFVLLSLISHSMFFLIGQNFIVLLEVHECALVLDSLRTAVGQELLVDQRIHYVLFSELGLLLLPGYYSVWFSDPYWKYERIWDWWWLWFLLCFLSVFYCFL